MPTTTPASPSRAPDVAGAPAPRRRRRVSVPGVRLEQPHWDAGLVVAGIDEVGRGALAGPVTFGAVVLCPDRRLYKLRDSKVLAPAEREHLAGRIHAKAEAVALGDATNEEIDALGMSAAMRLAARRAVEALPVRPDVLLIDGNWDLLADHGTRNQTVIRGDGRSVSIAAASIVAKVDRDRRMVAADPQHPAYGFASNKGYASRSHRDALDRHGPCALHRHTWAPVASVRLPGILDDIA